MPPEFLTLEDVLGIHADQIQRYGGEPGTRDLGLVESAVSMPRAMFSGQFLHEDIFAMAAAYLFHLVQNHPFMDGNKRAGAAVALVFLEVNGVEIHATEDALVELVLAVAQGRIEKPAIAAFFRQNA